jgi:hypothetical protein
MKEGKRGREETNFINIGIWNEFSYIRPVCGFSRLHIFYYATQTRRKMEREWK